MKCESCKKDNADGVKFCKYCGTPLVGNILRCVNGHNYDSSYSKCPFCPDTDNEKTVMDTPKINSTRNQFNRGYDVDKTIMDTSSPVLTPNRQPSQSFANNEKTVIYTPGNQQVTGINNSQSFVTQNATRKLIGWLVTYDINPNGTDYRIFEGRTRLGKRNTNDIIINHPGISDEHAIMLFRDGKIVIQDNLSTNGTFVNGEMIDEKTTIKNDDIIKLGNLTLKLKVI